MSQATRRNRVEVIFSAEEETLKQFERSLDFSKFQGKSYTDATDLINSNVARKLLREFQRNLELKGYKILKSKEK